MEYDLPEGMTLSDFYDSEPDNYDYESEQELPVSDFEDNEPEIIPFDDPRNDLVIIDEEIEWVIDIIYQVGEELEIVNI